MVLKYRPTKKMNRPSQFQPKSGYFRGLNTKAPNTFLSEIRSDGQVERAGVGILPEEDEAEREDAADDAGHEEDERDARVDDGVYQSDAHDRGDLRCDPGHGRDAAALLVREAGRPG